MTTLAMLQFLPDYPVKAPVPRPQGAAPDRLQLKPLLLALFSVFFFQAANMGLYAFIIGLGKRHGLEVTFISETLGLANWFATLGAVLVIVVSTRFGIFKPILGGMLLALVGTYTFNYCEVKWIWIAANIGTGIMWNFVVSHLLGMCARFDQTGRTAVWGGFASKMGLASIQLERQHPADIAHSSGLERNLARDQRENSAPAGEHRDVLLVIHGIGHWACHHAAQRSFPATIRVEQTRTVWGTCFGVIQRFVTLTGTVTLPVDVWSTCWPT